MKWTRKNTVELSLLIVGALVGGFLVQLGIEKLL